MSKRWSRRTEWWAVGAALLLATFGDAPARGESCTVCPPVTGAAATTAAAPSPAVTASPLTGTPLDYFTNYGRYMPRTHCMVDAAGRPDWPWIAALVTVTAAVVAGYLRIVQFWRAAYLQEQERDRNVKLMQLAYIFLLCAVCGYAMSMLAFVWPAYRLLTLFMVALAAITWRFIYTLGDFGVSFSARRFERLLGEQVAVRTTELQASVRAATTDLRLTNEQLRAAEARFNQIVRNVPGMVYQFVRHPDGRYALTYVSDGVANLYGVDAAAAVADVSRLMGECVHADDRAAHLASIEASYASGDDWEHEWRIGTADGSQKWLRGQSRCRRSDDGSAVWDGVVIDVTEAKAANAALDASRREARKLALVAASTGNGVIIMDRTGRVEWVNPAFTRMSGYAAADVVGHYPGAVLAGPDTDPVALGRMRESIDAGRPSDSEMVHYHKAGHAFWARVDLQPVAGDRGGVEQFVAVLSDVTQAKAQAAELARARDAAEAASRAKSDFLANMSHEIRTPLNGVVGMLALLEGTPLEGGQRHHVGVARDSAAVLLTLINDILDFSKIEAGKLELDPAPFDLAAVAAGAVAIVGSRADAKGLSVACHVDPAVDHRRVGPADRVRQVLVNLLGNAVKFTAAGSVTLSITPEVGRDGGDGLVRFAVTDTGIGIPADRLDRLFKSFSQVDAGTTRQYGGTGLGLAISKQLAGLMGGTIGVDSTPGKGSTFWFTARLPVDTTTINVTAAGPVPLAHTAVDLTGRRVLVAEDNEVNQMVVGELLRRLGCWADLVDNGHAAVLAVAGGGYDLVLMDCQMPTMDGFAATAAIRLAEDPGRRLPVIALTANAIKGDRERCMAAGMDDYLTKPIDARALAAKLAAWMPAAARAA